MKFLHSYNLTTIKLSKLNSPICLQTDNTFKKLKSAPEWIIFPLYSIPLESVICKKQEKISAKHNGSDYREYWPLIRNGHKFRAMCARFRKVSLFIAFSRARKFSHASAVIVTISNCTIAISVNAEYHCAVKQR